MNRARSYSEKTVKTLFGQCGGRCAKCKKPVFEPFDDGDPTIVGEIAHIQAFGKKGPRANPSLPSDQVNALPNLIVLCAVCHKVVDEQVSIYPADTLLKMKADHEQWVSDMLEAATAKVTFKELDEICAGVAILVGTDNGDMRYIQPDQKIKLNGLSNGPKRLITLGAANDHLVLEFIAGKLETDSQFESRLVHGLKSLYHGCLSRGLSSDSVYYELLKSVTRGSSDELVRAAGSSVLSHYFISCDIFEKDAPAK